MTALEPATSHVSTPSTAARVEGQSSPAEQPAIAPLQVSVCIPAYNEAAVIAETVEEAATVLLATPGDHEILVVDDGSQDDTWSILCGMRAQFPMLRPLRHSSNRGLAAAQQTLIKEARGEYIFHIGADRQWHMADIPRMLAVIEQGSDVVIGVRIQKQYTAWRKFVSASFNGLVALLWGHHFGDLGSIKLVRSKLWKQVPFGASSAFLHAKRLLIAYQNGARIATIPVEHLPRLSGDSSFGSPWAAAFALLDLLRFRLSRLNRYRLPADWRGEDGAS